ncbi:MAG TPA: family 16 glycoside hydrolase [Anaerolineales bacterium]|nr:family 16 glycoside hydrolase [Anaerolineales bacterium]
MKGKLFKLVLCCVVAIMTLTACGLPAGGGGGQSAAATLPPAQQATQPATQASTGKYFQEDFNGSLTNWSQFVINGSKVPKGGNPELVQGNFGTMSVGVKDGFLVFDLEGNGQWAYSIYDAQQYDDVRLDASVENRGSSDNKVGLMCRYDGTEWYEFDVANSGLYAIYEVAVQTDQTVVYSKLADGGYSKYKTGKDTNQLAVTCQGRTLTLFINGLQVKQIDDNQYELKNGKIGVSVWSNVTPPTTVGIDWIKIGQP